MNGMDMTIGEFAAQTGLTPRALRLYEERGILAPASVDPATGYRRYGATQLRAAVLMKALRDAGVPMAELAKVDTFGFDAYRESRTRAREEEDRALDIAEAVGGIDLAEWPVSVTEAPSQAWAGIRIVTDIDSSDEVFDDDDANACFGALYTALRDGGFPPGPAFWTGMGAVDSERLRIDLCWPVPADPREGSWAEIGARVAQGLPPALAAHAEIVAGVLPARIEVTATGMRFAEHQTERAMLISGLAPGLALSEYLQRNGLEPLSRQVRQRGVIGPDGMPVGNEVVMDVAAGPPE